MAPQGEDNVVEPAPEAEEVELVATEEVEPEADAPATEAPEAEEEAPAVTEEVKKPADEEAEPEKKGEEEEALEKAPHVSADAPWGERMWEVFSTFWPLGLIAFGGPQVSSMYRKMDPRKIRDVSSNSFFIMFSSLARR
jgi:hypothetical protein